MKIAVYAICKNEKHNIESFLASALEADAVFVTDTGSTDGSYDVWVEKVRQHDNLNFFQTLLKPFRFDVARNFCMNQIPEDFDYCLFLDLDETFEEGWYEKLTSELLQVPEANEIFMDIAYRTDGEGNIKNTYYQQRGHSRLGFVWRYPCHETLISALPKPILVNSKVEVSHNPDGKTRNYIDLLEMGAKERPDDQRALYYYGRELYFAQRYTEAIETLTQALDVEYMQWSKQKAACYKYIAYSISELSGFKDAEPYYLQYLSLSLDEAEALYEVAYAYYENGEMYTAKGLCKRLEKLIALGIKTDNFIYRDLECWSWKPFDLLAYINYELGDFKGYLNSAVKALELCPYENDRLKANVLDAYQTVEGNVKNE